MNLHNYLCVLFSAFLNTDRTTKAKVLIVGGDDALIKDFPYQLQLYRNGYFDCGATLIKDNMALTAAHCVDDRYDKYTIRGGSSILEGTNDLETPMWFGIEEKMIHPNWSRTNADYDLAILRLNGSFTLNEFTSLGKISDGNGPRPGDIGIATGWGALRKYPNQLQVVQLPVQSDEYCRSYHAMTERVFCAGNQSGDVGVCNGDSGGPLVVNGFVEGVASYVQDYTCKLGFFAKIAAMRDFIREKAGI